MLVGRGAAAAEAPAAPRAIAASRCLCCPDTSCLPQKHVQLFYINKSPSWSFTAADKYWVRPSCSNVSLTVINIDFVQLKYSYKI